MKLDASIALAVAFLVGSILIGGEGLSYGQVGPTEQVAPPGPAEMEPSPRISMEFQEADIREVLKVLAQQAGLNFVIARDVKGRRITLFLRDVSIEDALEAIMEAAGLAYEWRGGDCIIKELELKNREGG